MSRWSAASSDRTRSTALRCTIVITQASAVPWVGVVGLLILGSSLNIIALNPADNGLHLASAVLLLAVGLATDRKTAAARRATVDRA
ncbi:MAG: DUF4383 domain-containing protein [Solirubrobacterales bacterium]|nr:DUF4383 domain-containing protein [Solirubrobacterales bacterium]